MTYAGAAEASHAPSVSSSDRAHQDVFHTASFEEVYRTHVHAVYRFALTLAHRKEPAEDLTSEAFLALYRRFETIDQRQLPAWLLTVVRNRARDWWRHQGVEQRHADALVPCASAAVSPLEEWMEGNRDLRPIHRTCLMLRYADGLTREEIAVRTGLSEMQVKGHLQYGLALLRKQVGDHTTRTFALQTLDTRP